MFVSSRSRPIKPRQVLLTEGDILRAFNEYAMAVITYLEAIGQALREAPALLGY